MENRIIKAGVIGFPITHSLSPYIFEFISNTLKIQITYERYEVNKEACSSFISNFKINSSNIGLNVTIPLKELCLNYLDVIPTQNHQKDL